MCISKLECLYFKFVTKYYSTTLGPLQCTGRDIGSSKKQISSLARVRTAGAPQGLAQELHFPLGAHETELQRLSAPAFESMTCGP
jgi:hypothetical protein